MNMTLYDSIPSIWLSSGWLFCHMAHIEKSTGSSSHSGIKKRGWSVNHNGECKIARSETTHCFTTGGSTSLEAFLRLRPTCRVHQGPKSSVATHLSQMKGITAAECITTCRTSFGCSPRGLIPTKRLNTTSAAVVLEMQFLWKWVRMQMAQRPM